MARILCIDDDAAVREVLGRLLTQQGHEADSVASTPEALRAIQAKLYHLILCDYMMPGTTGLDLLAALDTAGIRIPVIIMTGFSSVEHAVLSIRSGAVDYLTKPISADALLIAVDQALEINRLRLENASFREELQSIRARRALIGESPALAALLETIEVVAPTRATVLLDGESGTGKELVARALHARSPRHAGPFVTINCAALPEGLVESVLFGHEKGAFTGATARSRGAFERATGGTLLLDEITEMRLDLQAKLLRALQEGEVERVGGSGPIPVDVRLVATTNRDLQAEVDAGRFRADLYYRLNVVSITTPPLRDRRTDIPLLVQHFIAKAASDNNIAPPWVTPEAMDCLVAYHWPGNVRELENAIERAVILSRGGVLEVAALPAAIRMGVVPRLGPITDPPLRRGSDPTTLDLRALEEWAIRQALIATGGNRAQAARLLGVTERTIRNKLGPISKVPQEGCTAPGKSFFPVQEVSS